MEYIKLYWNHKLVQEEQEPIIFIYEVDLQNDRYATRCIEVYKNGHVITVEDKEWGLVTEAPVPTIEEFNSDAYGEEFKAYLITKEEFEYIWTSKKYESK